MFYSFKRVLSVSSVLVGFLFSITACGDGDSKNWDEYFLTGKEINTTVDMVKNTPGMDYVPESPKNTVINRNYKDYVPSLDSMCLYTNKLEIALVGMNPKDYDFADITFKDFKSPNALGLNQRLAVFNDDNEALKRFNMLNSRTADCSKALGYAFSKVDNINHVIRWDKNESQGQHSFYIIFLNRNSILSIHVVKPGEGKYDGKDKPAILNALMHTVKAKANK